MKCEREARFLSTGCRLTDEIIVCACAMNSIVRKTMLSTGVLLILFNLLVQQCHTSPEFEYSNYNSNSHSNFGSRQSSSPASASSSSSAASPFSLYRRNQEQIHRFKSLNRVFNRLARGGSGSGGGEGSNSNSNGVLGGNSPVPKVSHSHSFRWSLMEFTTEVDSDED